MRIRSITRFAIAALVIGALVFLLVENRTGPNQTNHDSTRIHASADDGSVVADSEDVTQQGAHTLGGEAGSRRVPHPFPDLPRSRRGLDLEDDPFVAESAEEQAWLDRNGYPNSVQWETLINANDVQLLQAAMAGDKTAKAILASRRLASGEFDARDELLLAGAEGSLFALELLASSLAGASSVRDPVKAYAVTRVIEMKGNSRTGASRDLMFSQPLSPSQRLEAEAQAQQLLRVINEAQRRMMGERVKLVDARPVGI